MRWFACHVLGVKRDELTPLRYQRIMQRMRELSRHERWTTFLGLVPGMAAIALIPFWKDLAARFSIPWRVAFEGSFALCVIVYVYWLTRRRFARFGWRALRDLGYADVCARCGYDLSRQPQPEGVCPECGERFSQFRPEESVTRDQR